MSPKKLDLSDIPQSPQSPINVFLFIDFDDLVKKTEKRLRSFIRRRIWNPDEVEDLLQASFLEALRSQDKFRGHSAPETWLFGIAMNLIRSHMRKSIQWKEYATEIMLEEVFTHFAEDPCDALIRQTVLAHLSMAFERLSPEMRKTLLLIVEQGVSYQQAAQELGIPIGTVRSRLNRARQMLREYIDQPATFSSGSLTGRTTGISQGEDGPEY
jgi:RNA polymerase sigma factor (sigma-70 family)